jgi:hypothetical protein
LPKSDIARFRCGFPELIIICRKLLQNSSLRQTFGGKRHPDSLFGIQIAGLPMESPGEATCELRFIRAQLSVIGSQQCTRANSPNWLH